MNPLTTAQAAVTWLRTPAAIRTRCGLIYAAAEADQLQHFSLALAQLDPAADYVIATMQENYPDGAIPYHSRWRHFAAGGHDRWAELAQPLEVAALERARRRIELAIVSVLLDAGAGGQWRFRDADGEIYSRSEGLAVASLAMVASGLFSAQTDTPFRIDAKALIQLDEVTLGQGFQVSTHNPLVGLAGRVALLQRLGEVMQNNIKVFGSPARLGYFFDHLADQAEDKRLAAATILQSLLDTFSAIWPGRLALGGLPLGDVWRHPAARNHDPNDLSDGLVPFHKLSQWLCYSLLEPLQEAGYEITELDDLTGLPEYRNGGLLIDLGVLQPKHPAVLTESQRADSELVVEWRALTVVLLDRLAERIRAKLGMNSAQLPLAKVLEGGSWSAGRKIALEKRADGGPPIRLDSDGTVF